MEKRTSLPTQDPLGAAMLLLLVGFGLVNYYDIGVVVAISNLSIAVLSLVIAFLYYIRVRSLPSSVQSPLGDILIILSGVYVAINALVIQFSAEQLPLFWAFFLVILGILSRIFLFDRFFLYILTNIEQRILYAVKWVFTSFLNLFRIVLLLLIVLTLISIPFWSFQSIQPFTIIFALSSVYFLLDILEPRKVRFIWRAAVIPGFLYVIFNLHIDNLQLLITESTFLLLSFVWIIAIDNFKKFLSFLRQSVISAINSIKSLFTYIMENKVKSFQTTFVIIGGIFLFLAYINVNFKFLLIGIGSLFIASIPSLPRFITSFSNWIVQTTKSIIHSIRQFITTFSNWLVQTTKSLLRTVKQYPLETFQVTSAVFAVISLLFGPNTTPVFDIPLRILLFCLFLFLAVFPSIYSWLRRAISDFFHGLYRAIQSFGIFLINFFRRLKSSIYAIYRFVVDKPFTTLRIITGIATPILLLLGALIDPNFYIIAAATFIVAISPYLYRTIKYIYLRLGALLANVDFYYWTLATLSFGTLLFTSLELTYRIIALAIGSLSISLVNDGYIMRIYDQLLLTVYRMVHGILFFGYRIVKNLSFNSLMSFTGIVFILAGIFLPRFVTITSFQGAIRFGLIILGIFIWTMANPERRKRVKSFLKWIWRVLFSIFNWAFQHILIILLFLTAVGLAILAISTLLGVSFLSRAIGDPLVSFIISSFFFLISGLSFRVAIVRRDSLRIDRLGGSKQ